MRRSIFRNSRFGIAVYRGLETNPIFELNASTIFAAASVTKIVTCLTALDVKGSEARFETCVTYTGDIDASGTLKGNLSLIATGDPNLSNRIVGDSLVFESIDHAAEDGPDATPVPGNPAAVILDLARQIHDAGVKEVCGEIQVDTSFFDAEAGPAAISPVCVNDNIIDVRITASNHLHEPANIYCAPLPSNARIKNNTITVPKGARQTLRLSVAENLPATLVVTVSGSVPEGESIWRFCTVAHPSQFAASVLTHELTEVGVSIAPQRKRPPDIGTGVEIARHTSPPLREAVKVTLKVSQNLHADLLILAAGHGNSERGFSKARDLLGKAGADLSEVAQADGAGRTGRFSPASICRLLQYAMQQPYARDFFDALPILGVDGTLHNIQKDSPSSGRVYAKTGTDFDIDKLNSNRLLVKALAGYVDANSGARYIFTIFANDVRIKSDSEIHDVGEALGEMASVIQQLL